MITLKTLYWSNPFSYGKDNVIHFDKNPLTQLVGKNGHGKTSIPLILEEGLFNKNSKGIKKSDILNRYVKDKSYSIGVDFDKDGDLYEIRTSRGSSQTVSFFKNGDNISAHTATATFKLIEDTLGFDHKTFSQLVYQSSASSLEFLTATDTNRKKFLIDLLNLTRYMDAFEHFKMLGKVISDEVVALESKIKTTQAWLDKAAKENLDEKSIRGYPVYEDDPKKELVVVSYELESINTTNKRISQNTHYKEQLEAIPLDVITKPIPLVESDKAYQIDIGCKRSVIQSADALISKISKLKGVCPTCMQPVDLSLLTKLIDEQKSLKEDAEKAIKLLDSKVAEIAALSKDVARATKLKTDWETYHSLIEPSLSSEQLDADELQDKIAKLQTIINTRSVELKEIEEYNSKAIAHNSKVSVILSQMEEMRSSLGTYAVELSALSGRVNILQILQKTFSTNGLIAYKIECLVKDLEILANEYLAELSSGRFQLTFKVASGDKLNVIITDNGVDIDISALSGGERARVNAATLIAIRKLMQSLSNARINLLILDETIDALDVEGKEKLIEVLLAEQNLNTFLVSHGFTHPLLEKITVIKEHNISRLE